MALRMAKEAIGRLQMVSMYLWLCSRKGLPVDFRTPGEEDLHELAIAEPRIQLGTRGVDQKQNEDPDLDSSKAAPGEVSRHVMGSRYHRRRARKYRTLGLSTWIGIRC
jgi:hypothetical protein